MMDTQAYIDSFHESLRAYVAACPEGFKTGLLDIDHDPHRRLALEHVLRRKAAGGQHRCDLDRLQLDFTDRR